MPLPVSNDPVTDQGRLYVSPSLPVGDGGLPIAPVADPDAAAMANVPTDGNANVPNVATRVINKLLGTGGEERYKTWPEKLLRDALSAPHDVLNNTVPSTSGDLIKPALDMSALAGTGGLGGVGEGAIRTSPEVAKDAIRYYHGGENPTSGGGRWLTPSQEYAKNYGIGNKEVHYVDLPIDKAIELGGYDEINSLPRNFNAPENIAKNLKSVTSFLNSDVTLGSSPFLRPALKYEGKIYKAPVGGEHMDAIPETLRPEFTKQAMSGEDISNFNFGFMNHKGQFLDREKALKYAIDEGLLSPHDAKYGALTSTLMADSSKEAAAIKAMEYPLAKPSDRWSNTLGQNDNLIQNMTPDQFLNKSRKLKIDAESRETIDDLKQHIEEGKSLDPLELHSNGKEDGRHRAIAAKELGIKEVPVINFRADSGKEAAALDSVNKTLPKNVDWKSLDTVERSLGPEASEALTRWVGGPPGAKEGGQEFGIFDRYGATKAFNDPKIKDELYKSFQPLRDKLKNEHGDEITLYRYHGDIPENAKPHDVLSFTSDPQIAEWASGAPKERTLHSEAEIKAKEAEFEKTGKVQINKHTWLEKKTETFDPAAFGAHGQPREITYTAIMRPDGMVTDTPSVREYLTDLNNDKAEINAKRSEAMSKVKAYKIPVDDIIAATDRFGQKEFIVRNSKKLYSSGIPIVSKDQK